MEINSSVLCLYPLQVYPTESLCALSWEVGHKNCMRSRSWIGLRQQSREKVALSSSEGRGKGAKVHASHGQEMQIWPEPNLKETPPKMAGWSGDIAQKMGRGRVSRNSGSKGPKGGLDAPESLQFNCPSRENSENRL